MSDIETNEVMKSTVAAMTEGSKLKSNGLREVSRDAYRSALETQGVTEDMVKQVFNANAFVTTAAGHVALADLEAKVAGASKDDLENDAFRKGLSATVRIPTFGGSTEARVTAESVNPIPFRADADGNGEPQFSTTYGRLSVKQNTKGLIHRDFHTETDARMRKALGKPAREA